MLKALILAAAALNGLLAGASLDQSIKQVPSRNRIGIKNYAVYARGADLGPGVYWYAILSNAAVLASIAAAWLGWVQTSGRLLVPLQLCAVFSLAHTVATLRAAPTMFKTSKVSLDDEQTLRTLFDRFARWQALRATLQVLTFALSLWSVVLLFAR
jgi:hypothetical protein